MRPAVVVLLPLAAASAVAAACAAFDADDRGEPGADGGSADASPFLPPLPAPYDAGLRCDPAAPFGPPTQLGGLSNHSVEAVRFGFNRQLVYLSLCPRTGDKAGCEMYQGAADQNLPDGYVSFTPLTGVNAAGYDSYPTVNGRADTILVGSSRVSPVRLYYATADGGIFASPKLLDPGVTLYASNEPYLLADGKTLYFAGSKQNGPPWRIYRSTGGAPAFAAPTALSDIESPQGELAPMPTEDELEIFFSSARPPGSDANLEIWTARRRTTAEPFGAPTRLDGAFSGPGNDWPTWISPDACDFYFIKKDAAGVATPFVARRAKPR